MYFQYQFQIRHPPGAIPRGGGGKDINKIFDLPPVYDLASGLSYKAYSDIIKINKGGQSGYGVNVYDKGKLVEGSPFSSYTLKLRFNALGNINFCNIKTK